MPKQLLKTHYGGFRQTRLCGLSSRYKGVTGHENVPLVTCWTCMRSLMANGGDMVKYKPPRRERIKGRWYNFPAQIVPV